MNLKESKYENIKQLAMCNENGNTEIQKYRN